MSETCILNNFEICCKSICCMWVIKISFWKSNLSLLILSLCLEILDWLILLKSHTKKSSINIERSLLTLELYDHLHLLSAEILYDIFCVECGYSYPVNHFTGSQHMPLRSYVVSLLESTEWIYHSSLASS